MTEFADTLPTPLDVSRHTEADRIFTLENTPGLTYRDITALNRTLQLLIIQGVRAREAKDIIVDAVGRGIHPIDLPLCTFERIVGLQP